MQLSKASESRLMDWLGRSTWHTADRRDMRYWHLFVDQYERDNGCTIDEAALREHIEHKLRTLGCDVGGDEADAEGSLRSEIRERISLAVNILEFLEDTGR